MNFAFISFNFSYIFSPEGLFIISSAIFISYLFYSFLRSHFKWSFLSFFVFVPISIFFVAKDERTTLVKKIEKRAEKSADVNLLRHLSRIYEYEGDITSAVKTYMKIIQVDPTDEDTLLKLAIIFAQMGNVDLSLHIIQNILKSNPSNVIAKHLYDVLTKIKSGEEEGKKENIKEK